MKIMNKVILIVLMLITIASISLSVNVLAADDFDWNTAIANQTSGTSGEEMTPIENIAGSIMVIFRIACVGIAMVMLIVLGMKYMVSAPGDRATVKKHAVVYVVGAVVLFATSGILSIIQKFAEGNLNSTGAGAGSGSV